MYSDQGLKHESQGEALGLVAESIVGYNLQLIRVPG